MKAFKNAKWIWANAPTQKDNYGEFFTEFSLTGEKNARLRIACDSVYAAYVNDTLVGFSQCADYPNYKLYDEIEIGRYCKGAGEKNALRIVVWYWGEDSQIYIKDDAGVIFEVEETGNVLVSSDENVLSRSEFGYKNGREKKITVQLGYTFWFDNTAALAPYAPSRAVEKTKELHLRTLLQMQLKERLPIKVERTADGYLVDMGKETAGYFDLDIESADKQHILFAYGEHIVDGRVRHIIESRDFSFDFVAKKGKNVYFNPLRRIAGRYIQVYCKSELKINYIGVLPVYYPVTLKENPFKDPLDKKIYDVSVETLRLCMHEHYEDCPWREQALYTMDSRNQMLCGYYAYEGFEYQRYNLCLIAKGLRADGVLSICYPSGIDLPIPSFSLAYFLQVYEYVKYSGDESLLDEVGYVLDTLMETFESRIDENGLIPRFLYPCWNFYEWNEKGNMGCYGEGETPEKQYDLVLNAMFLFVAEKYDELKKRKVDRTRQKQAIQNTFFMADKGVYKISTDTEKYSQLGNAYAILIGLGDKALAEKIVNDKEMITATLSMRAFVYDALLTFGDTYKNYVLEDIRGRYKKMLDEGATSFWETEIGEADFFGAGSLCHGWSALPIYYFKTLIK